MVSFFRWTDSFFIWKFPENYVPSRIQKLLMLEHKFSFFGRKNINFAANKNKAQYFRALKIKKIEVHLLKKQMKKKNREFSLLKLFFFIIFIACASSVFPACAPVTFNKVVVPAVFVKFKPGIDDIFFISVYFFSYVVHFLNVSVAV